MRREAVQMEFRRPKMIEATRWSSWSGTRCLISSRPNTAKAYAGCHERVLGGENIADGFEVLGLKGGPAAGWRPTPAPAGNGSTVQIGDHP